jgi:D-erythro-7,8-dihydroneopterin triphosphate epimerase
MDTDRIIISDLTARCIIGTNEAERTRKQDILINLVLFADLYKAGKSDRLEDSIDYRGLRDDVLSLVENSGFFLVEALAGAIADACLVNTKILTVTVRVEKPGALRHAASVGVEITRGRRDVNDG